MDIKEDNRRDIEFRLRDMGDFVKIDYLTSCLQGKLDFDTRRFCQLKLSKLYYERGMLKEAAKLLNAAADLNPTEDGRMNDYTKTGELFIKSGDFINADIAFGKAIAVGSTKQKEKIQEIKKQTYMLQAEIALSRGKRKEAAKTYDKILSLHLSETEKRHVKATLLDLYEKLGMVREFFALKNSV